MQKNKVNLVGHPYIPIGMGEHIRTTTRAMRSVAQAATLTDIFGFTEATTEDHAEFSAVCTQEAGDVNVYHINGNEVEQSLVHLQSKRGWSGYNVIYPLWELPRYPEVWAKQLDKFDEIWAPSKYIFEALKTACKKPVFHMPMACEVKVSQFYNRRYFNIPETAYVFLFFYDLRSFTARKNPHAVVSAFRKTLNKRPYASAHLVIKVNGADIKPDEFKALQKELIEFGAHVTLIEKIMTSTEVKNLTRCCDSFVSLHRSEGYGFGIAEAMVLGKPVICTGYSGNMDFMDAVVSYAVDYKLINVKEGEYPHYENQVWADPNVEQATQYMVNLLDNANVGRALGTTAKKHMQNKFSYRNIGLNYINRLNEIDSNIRRSI